MRARLLEELEIQGVDGCVERGIAPPEHGERIAAEYGGPVTNVVFDDGVHILNNIYYKARPFVADWLAETLTGTTS